MLAPADCTQTAQVGGGTESCFNGTSSATPFTAGVVAALLEAANEPLNSDQMRHVLVTSGVAVSDPKSDWIKPRIDAEAALQQLSGDHHDDSGGPCDDCENWRGVLTSAHNWEVQPNNTYYFSQDGTHQGWLRGPSDADFDLYLFKFIDSKWVAVAASENEDSEEMISYHGTSGYYTWGIYAYNGQGSYQFWLDKP